MVPQRNEEFAAKRHASDKEDKMLSLSTAVKLRWRVTFWVQSSEERFMHLTGVKRHVDDIPPNKAMSPFACC